jgi:hypothetical protein
MKYNTGPAWPLAATFENPMPAAAGAVEQRGGESHLPEWPHSSEGSLAHS